MLLPELQRNKYTARCVALCAEVPGHCQQHLTQTSLVRLLKTHFFTHRSLIVKSQQNRIQLVTRPDLAQSQPDVVAGLHGLGRVLVHSHPVGTQLLRIRVKPHLRIRRRRRSWGRRGRQRESQGPLRVNHFARQLNQLDFTPGLFGLIFR